MKFEEILSRYILDEYSVEDKEIVDAWKKDKCVSDKTIFLLKYAFKPADQNKQYPTEALKKSIAYRLNSQAVDKAKKINVAFLVRIAAVILLPLLILTSIFHFNKSTDEKMSFITMNVPMGITSKLLLPDGSEVVLNSGSTIKYSSSIHSSKNRIVELDGEGYFKVKSDINHPFIVKTLQLNVEVLGTKFNVKSYKNEADVTVALIEGSVKLTEGDVTRANDIVILKPGQVARKNKRESKVKVGDDSDIIKNISWKDGVITFVKEPFSSVLKTMARKYNVQFMIKDKELEKVLVTAKFNNETLEEFLFIISSTTETKYEIITKPKDNNKKQIIITKADN